MEDIKAACPGCYWANPETCKACKAGEKTVVLAVNSQGIKKDGGKK